MGSTCFKEVYYGTQYTYNLLSIPSIPSNCIVVKQVCASIRHCFVDVQPLVVPSLRQTPPKQCLTIMQIPTIINSLLIMIFEYTIRLVPRPIFLYYNEVEKQAWGRLYWGRLFWVFGISGEFRMGIYTITKIAPYVAIASITIFHFSSFISLAVFSVIDMFYYTVYYS